MNNETHLPAWFVQVWCSMNRNGELYEMVHEAEIYGAFSKGEEIGIRGIPCAKSK